MKISRKTICIVADDMFFSSKIETIARNIGINTVKVKNREELQKKTEGVSLDLVIIDLVSKKIDSEEAFTKFKKSSEHKKTFCIGYLPHVELEIASKFKEKGVDLVIPKSKFSRQASTIIKKYLKPG